MEKGTKQRDYYAILGVSPSATTADIKAAFRKHVLTVHPDKRGGDDVAGEHEFHQLKAAHDTLVDDYRRNIYDKFGEEGLSFLEQTRSNPQFGAVSHKMHTPEQIHYMLKKMQHQSKRQWFQENVQLSGSVEAHTSLENIKRVIRGETRLPEVVGIGISNRVRIPFNADHDLFIGGHVSANPEGGNGGLSLATKHKLSGYTSLFTRSSFGTAHGEFVVGVKRQLTKHLVGSQSLHYNSRLNFTDMHVTLTRSLLLPWGTPVKGFVTGMFGAYYGVKAGIQKNIGHNAWSVATEIRRPFVSNSVSFTTPLSTDTWLALGGRVDVPLELGTSATLGFSLSKLSKVDIGVDIGTGGVSFIPGFARWGHQFRFPIMVAPFFSLEAAFATFIYTAIGTYLVRQLVILPWKRNKRQSKLALKRANLEEDRKKADKFLKGLKVTIDEKRKEEEAKGGLVIIHASYGNLGKRPNFVGATSDKTASLDDIPEEEENDPEILQVADQLQYLVEDSELHITEASKSNLPGFYDPVTGSDNYLEVWYMFNGALHQVLIHDEDPLHLPLKAHRR